MKSLLEAVLKTLNTVEVSGKKNLDGVLACILTIEDILGRLEENDENVDHQNKSTENP